MFSIDDAHALTLEELTWLSASTLIENQHVLSVCHSLTIFPRDPLVLTSLQNRNHPPQTEILEPSSILYSLIPTRNLPMYVYHPAHPPLPRLIPLP